MMMIRGLVFADGNRWGRVVRMLIKMEEGVAGRRRGVTGKRRGVARRRGVTGRRRELREGLLELEVLREGEGLLELEVSKRYNINNISN